MMDASRGLCGALLRGIVQFADLHGPWKFVVAEGVGPASLARLEKLSAGMIVQVNDAATASALDSVRVPTVAFHSGRSEANDRMASSTAPNRGAIVVDFASAGRVAAEHLQQRGVHSYAFVGCDGDGPTGEAFAGFREGAAAFSGFPQRYIPRPTARGRQEKSAQAGLAAWLMSLPRPVGVMAECEQLGRDVLDACRLAGLSVPLDVAVLAIEEDDLFCELADPPLTGVVFEAEAAGRQAAEMLRDMLQGDPAPGDITVGVGKLVERQSTRIVEVDDRQVAAALELIHKHATQPIGVEDIVGGLRISRRALELRFRKAVGRGPHAELQRARLLRAQELLVQTDLPIPQVAAAAGYSSGSYLAQVFQRRVAMSPAQYRRTHRGQNSAAWG
jgi:LacI family transcriptional regulator